MLYISATSGYALVQCCTMVNVSALIVLVVLAACLATVDHYDEVPFKCYVTLQGVELFSSGYFSITVECYSSYKGGGQNSNRKLYENLIGS